MRNKWRQSAILKHTVMPFARERRTPGTQLIAGTARTRTRHTQLIARLVSENCGCVTFLRLQAKMQFARKDGVYWQVSIEKCERATLNWVCYRLTKPSRIL